MSGELPNRIACLVFFLFLACSGGDGEAGSGPEISVEDPWARAMPVLGEAGEPGANSAVYCLIRNDGPKPDRLLGGDSPVASAVEIHLSEQVDDVMRMRRLEDLELPAGTSVQLAPGGLHLMLVGLRQALEPGQEFELTLRFRDAPDLLVNVPVGPIRGS
jgi:copper(I)-binding protein